MYASPADLAEAATTAERGHNVVAALPPCPAGAAPVLAALGRRLAAAPATGLRALILAAPDTSADWTEAATHLNAAVSADPHYVAARINLGQALSALGRSSEAVAQYRSALSDEPTAADAQTNLAALLLEQGQLVEAETLLRAALVADLTTTEVVCGHVDASVQA